MKKWRFINSGKMSPAENMAMDESILQGVIDGVSYPTVRVYDWAPPTVSLGYHQDAKKQINMDAVQKFGFGLVRRPTGGRAVLHWDEVTYSIISRNLGFFEGSILDVYKKIGKVLLGSLQEIGIEVDMKDSLPSSLEQKNWNSPCFSSASKYEISYKKRKIIGSAQMRKKNSFLQHGSILLNHNQAKMADFVPTKTVSEKRVLRKLLSKKTVPINELTEKPVSFKEFANMFKRRFQDEFQVDYVENSTLNSDEKLIYQKRLSEKQLEIESIYGYH